MKGWMLGGLFLAAGIAACSNKVAIAPDTSGSATGTGGSTMMTMGTGASSPGGSSSSSGTGGAGGAGPGSAKLVTADTDMAQYQAISVDLLSTQPALQGPFFITDVFVENTVTLSTVTGSDCTAPQTKFLLAINGNTQFHGMRIPILAGQSVCQTAGGGGKLTILGFKPY